MAPYTTNGTIRQQDFEARNIARSAIARCLAQEATHTTILVTLLISQLVTSTALIAPIDDLWNRLQNNPALRLLMNTTDANVDAFTQFSGWVNGARFALACAQKGVSLVHCRLVFHNNVSVTVCAPHHAITLLFEHPLRSFPLPTFPHCIDGFSVTPICAYCRIFRHCPSCSPFVSSLRSILHYRISGVNTSRCLLLTRFCASSASRRCKPFI
jgi:hypothetical protein